VKSRTSLAQATGSRLGETVIREPCETHGFSLKRAATRLSENTPRPKRASSLELHMKHIPQTPTCPHLGKLLSPERDDISLKRKLLACARAQARVWVCFYKSRLGEAGSLGRECRVSPFFILQQPYFHIQTIMPTIPDIHSNI